ncbi:PilZ domain-containing protein [Methylophaga sp. OBS4]|uniref:PilZ domain-containing protein n=1 Tax=Methylophaga sp. OBS4 TaxID=2991935 RepID=UPI0022505388|nr:PilZ domain-containing protein [Methylophaga sp. OBS4]MCX4186792.1 PilZ domain-containing protein [Methylophaga sp. OBS4]
MTSHDYEEKRSFVRMQIETQVTYSIKGENGITHHGISHDLSATGLLMSSDYAPAEGNELQVIMNTESERFPPFVAIGTVLRVEQDELRPDRYQISVALKQTE